MTKKIKIKKATKGKLLRYPFRFNGKVTTIAVKSYIVSLYLTLCGVRSHKHEFIRDVINNMLKDMDHKKSNKGLSEAVSVRLVATCLEKEEKKNFYRTMVELNGDLPNKETK